MVPFFDKLGRGFAPPNYTTQNGLVLHPFQNATGPGVAPAPWYQRMGAANPSRVLSPLPRPSFAMPSFYSIRPSGRS